MQIRIAPVSSVEETHEEPVSFGIVADVLIPGRGRPIPNGAVVVTGERITWVGPHADVPPELLAQTRQPWTSVPVLMPGLWDCHVHYEGAHAVELLNTTSSGYLPGASALIGALTVDDLRVTLMAGFTSVRELCGYGGEIRPAIDAGLIIGPTVYSSITALSIIGGHGDDHLLPLHTVLCRHGGPTAICTGPAECIARVREAVRRGAKVIKVCSSGGVLSVFDQPEKQQFSHEELAAIVQEADRAGLIVAAHAIGKPGIMAALNAGVKTIEHGFYLDAEAAAAMKDRDAILVPTRHVIESIMSDPSSLSPTQLEKATRMLQLSRSSLRLAVKAKVKIALGTDTLSSSRTNPLSHGNNAIELYWAVVAGMTPLEAIEACTATAPETLGPQAPLSGQLKEGYDADIIAVSSNPLLDVRVLGVADNITHVWKAGRLYKGQ